MDLTKLPEFAGGRQKATLHQAEDGQVKMLNLRASTQLHEPHPVKLKVQMDEARRFTDLAHQIQASFVRVFPNNLVKDEARKGTIKRIEESLRELASYAKFSGVTVLLESHGELADSRTLHEILSANAQQAVGLLWDTDHTFGEGHEAPAQTYQCVQKSVRLAQFIDFVREGKGFRYVLLGEAKMPVRDAGIRRSRNPKLRPHILWKRYADIWLPWERNESISSPTRLHGFQRVNADRPNPGTCVKENENAAIRHKVNTGEQIWKAADGSAPCMRSESWAV